ncbi:MAG: YcaO-like family protein [Acidobacteriota bacterium]
MASLSERSQASGPTGSGVRVDDPDGSRKGFREGTHRLVSPEQTLARRKSLMPVMGITRIANLTGLDDLGLPVVMVMRPNARSLAVSSGKGLTLAAAQASGLMEAIESYHAERVRNPLLLASYNELRFSHPLCDVGQLPRLAPSRFHEDLPLLWIEGHDLLGGEPCWVPYEMVHSNYTLPLPTGCGCFLMTSNGLASGNHHLEAVSHGICEVVERDAATLWMLNSTARERRGRVDLGTIEDPSCQRVLERFASAGIAVGLWEMTSDIGIPAFSCTLVDREPRGFFELYATSGLGCHPCRAVAALRALTEAAQTRLIYITGSRDDRDRRAYEEISNPETVRKARELVLEPKELPMDFRTIPSHDHGTLAEDVRWELDRLAAAGLEQVVVVDLERPEFGVPVVRVVIPGLEGFCEVPGYELGPRARAARG